MGIDRAIDITTAERSTVLALLEHHLPGTTAWGYGSRAKWISRPQSDLDLVVFSTPEQRRQVGNLREAFEESDLPFRVDLFVWDAMPESFRKQIESEHVVLVEGACSAPAPVWATVTIEDIAEKIAMGPFGSSIKVATFVPGGIPIISGQHLRGVRVDDSPGFNFVSDEHAQRLANANVKRGDVVLTHAGNIGQAAYISEQSKYDRYVISQRQFYMRCDRSRVIPEFIALWFSSPEGQHQLLANSSQVGVPAIAQPVTYLRSVEIPLPPLSEQRAIAHILGTLDEKIELSRRMSATLESTARALFKSWFVDFDPVHAKMEGRDTCLPKAVADLFPDRLVDSELGTIPQGWRVEALGETLKLAYGKALKAEDRRHDGTVPVYGSNGPIGWHDTRLVQGPGIVVGRKGNPGVVTWASGDFFPIDTTFYVVPRDGNIALHFLFHALQGHELPSMGSDSAVPGLNRNIAYMNRQIAPPREIVEQFGFYVRRIYARCHCLSAESRTLALLREALLPILVSGAIRCKCTRADAGVGERTGALS